MNLANFLDEQMEDAETQWSLGTFGALAEFSRDRDEPVTFNRGAASRAAVTARGGIRINLTDEMRPFAFETTTKDSWNHRIALCLPADCCAMNARTVLTELGPDAAALRPEDRGAVLFDLGLGALQVDCCVRATTLELAELLRAQCGSPAFGGPAMTAILAASPPRIFVSRVGRIEVFQPIPPPHGKSPEGPHTHVLPTLLRHRRTHAATEPIPAGFIPCAHVYPAHPAKDMQGQTRPFDRHRHNAFQNLLHRYGDPKFVALKQHVRDAVIAGADPFIVAVTDQRFTRTNIRVTLRQLRAAQEAAPSLDAWMAAHERAAHNDIVDDPHHHEARAS